jgi:TolB protein
MTGDSLIAFRENPAWSPEGSKLVFNQDNLLYTVDISAGEEQELETPFGSGIYHPSWSANNQLLFLYFAQKQYPQIWFAPEDTLEWKEFTPELAFQYDPVWAPDGRTYAFAGAPGTIKSQWYKTVFGGLTLTFYDIQPRDIYLVDVQSGQTTQLTSGREDEFHPAWSPDGQTLAFVSILDAKNPEIFTIKRDGSDLTRVTRNPAQEVHPSWSPDGSMIAFASDRDGNFEIYVTDTYGLLTTRMTANMMDDFQPVWSSAQTISPDQESVGQGASGDVWSFVPKRLKMEDLVNWLYKAGLVSTAKGRNEKLVSFKEEWAQINWYEYYLTGFSPGDFVVRTDARWETDSDKANWFSSGCGFVFREKDVDNHYMVHLGMDGIVYLSRYKNGAYPPIGRSSVRYPLETPADGANLMLAVEGDKIHFFVNGLLMLSEKDKSFQEGNLAYTLNSGTNKGFGTRCQMDNVELWTLKK